MVVVKLGNEKQKKKVMEGKRKIKDKNVWMNKDLEGGRNMEGKESQMDKKGSEKIKSGEKENKNGILQNMKERSENGTRGKQS